MTKRFIVANSRGWLQWCLSMLFSSSLHFLSKFRRKRRSSQYFGGQDLWLVGRVAGGRWRVGSYGPKMASSLSLFVFKPDAFAQQEPPFSSSWGLVSVTSKPSVFSFWESCHLSRVYQMALLTRNKARARAAPCWSRPRPRLSRQFYFLALSCPGTKHIISPRSPRMEQRYDTKPSVQKQASSSCLLSLPRGEEIMNTLQSYFKKMLC